MPTRPSSLLPAATPAEKFESGGLEDDNFSEMVRSYLKYEQSHSFGTVTSALSNTLWTFEKSSNNSNTKTGSGVAFVGANEEVLRWDVKKGELLSKWRDGQSTACVTALARSDADRDVYAAG